MNKGRAKKFAVWGAVALVAVSVGASLIDPPSTEAEASRAVVPDTSPPAAESTAPSASGAVTPADDDAGPEPEPLDRDRSESSSSSVGVSRGGIVVVDVTDGDTVDVLIGNDVEKVRLLGVNAPESGECLGTDATSLVEDLLANARVVRLVEATPERDRYGRLLTDILADDVSVSGSLVREGLALSVAYGRSKAEQEPLDRLQALAEQDSLGVWAPDACGTTSSVAVSIGGIEFDAPGDDGKNPNGEWIEIVAGTDVDLTGWSIRDESSSHRYAFPTGFTLAAEETVLVRSGCGSDSAYELFWCNTGSAIWNNDGDTGFLIDPSGSFVDTWRY